MKRALPLIVAVVIAAVLAWIVASGGDDGGARASAEIERRIRSGDVAGAERLIRDAKPRVPEWTGHYLDGLVALSKGQDDDARASAEAAVAADVRAIHDWRVQSLLFYSRINTSRGDAAWRGLDAYLQAHPDDERALAVAAEYWTDGRPRDPDPDRAAGYLDRIDGLAARTVPDDDPTAVTAAQIARLRGRADTLRGRVTDAVAHGEREVKERPDDPEARIRLAEAYRAARRLRDASGEYDAAVRLAPSRLVWRKQWALVLLEEGGDAERALDVTAGLLALAPGDPEARVLRARALARKDGGRDDRALAEAIDIYRALRRESLLENLRREVARNLGVALYDFKQGGRPGDYLDEAHGLLAEYVRLGGEIDLRLGDIWERLEARSKAKDAPPR